MANEYLYGAYGHIGQTIAQSAVQAGTVLVYFGTAPVNLVRGYAEMDIIHNPVRLSNIGEAQRKFGYSPNWKDFTLCEVFTGHFDNPIGNIGPIYVVNVLDPAVNRKTEETTRSLLFNNGRVEFKSDTIILDTLVLEDFVEYVDFTMDYNYAKNTVILKSLDEENPLNGAKNVSYYEIDSAAVTQEDIIGGVTASGEYKGIGALQLLYQEQTAVANILAAPGWSHIPAVYNALISASQKINGHWDRNSGFQSYGNYVAAGRRSA